MTERRYTEEEVAAIFERAAEAQASGSSPVAREGSTLAELQRIGADVGIPPELVAQAATSLDRGGRPMRESFLGFPLAVGRTVELDRHLTDDEWARLVADLRTTFNAQGKIRADGPFRQWSNGNLRATLEPTGSGDRLRIRTMKGDVRGYMNAGLGMIGMGVLLFLIFLIGGEPASDMTPTLILALGGSALFGMGAIQLPGWAATRLEQMEGVATRLAASVEAAGSPDSRALESGP